MNFRKELDNEVKKYLQDQTDAERSDIQIEFEDLVKKIDSMLDGKIMYELKQNISDFTANEHLLFTLEPTIFGDNDNSLEVTCLKVLHIQPFIKSSPQYTSEAEWNKIIHEAILRHLKKDNRVEKFKCDDLEAYELL